MSHPVTRYSARGSIPLEAFIGAVVSVNGAEHDGTITGFRYSLETNSFWISLSNGTGVPLMPDGQIEFHLQSPEGH